jgi:hypothetical protein
MSSNPISSRVELMAQGIAERVVSLVLEAIDINTILDKVDIERLIERVDLNKVVEQIDVEKVIEQIDIETVIERIDINAIIDQIDVDKIVEQTELGSIIARSTTGVLTEILDVIRAQGVGLDDFVFRWGNRVVLRGAKTQDWPVGPPLLVHQELA